MDTLLSVFSFLLIGIAVAPLLMLGLYVLASYFELKGAERVLDATFQLLKLQWFSGGLLNIVGGLAIGALGVWMVVHFDPLLQRALGVLMVAFGLWRAARGVALLGAFSRTKDTP